MRKKRKEELLKIFPKVPQLLKDQMEGKGAFNFVILLTRTGSSELFARCYHRYSRGEIVERQRYVFAEDGVVRYGKNDNEPWKIRKTFSEPIFHKNGSFYFDNSYCILNADAIKNSFLKFAIVSTHSSVLFMSYLKLYCDHPNAEYLFKQGYGCLISERYSYYGNSLSLEISPLVNWKSNNLLKMLNINKLEFKALRGNETHYESYIYWRVLYPKLSPEVLIDIAKSFKFEHGTAERLADDTNLKLHRLARYLTENEIRLHDYEDYIEQCKLLQYDLHDTAISMPHNFMNAHTRLNNIIKYHDEEGLKSVFIKNMEKRKAIEFEYRNLVIRQPESIEEIISEGRALNHCVGGYAERHALNKLHIMFIRRRNAPEKPFYTVEISEPLLNIIQVRGERNADMTDEVKAFVDEYKKYLDDIKKETMIVKELK